SVGLAQAMLRSMALARLRTAAVWLLAGCLVLAGVGVAAHQAVPTEPGQNPRESPRQPMPPDDAKAMAAKDQPAGQASFGDPPPPGAVASIGTLRFRHEGDVSSLAFTPDGKSLAVLSRTDGVISFFETATGKVLHRLAPPPALDAVQTVAFAPQAVAF